MQLSEQRQDGRIRKMGKDLKKTIREMSKGRNLDENLPFYTKMLRKVNVTMAALRLSMDYETFFEQLILQESGTPEEIEEVFIRLEGYLQQLLGSTPMGITKELKEERSSIKEKMEILTACVDRLVNVEYVFNRMELNFCEDKGEDVPVSEFTGKVMQFIFTESDSVVTNGRIKEVLRQLPVRMSKSRFYDLIKNGLGLYKDEDAESLEGIIYMLRTSGNLYHSEGMERYFSAFMGEIEELEKLGYDGMSKEEYEKAGEKLRHISDKLRLLTDNYVSLQTIVNEMLALSLLHNGEEGILDEKIGYILKKECEMLSYKKCMENPDFMKDEMDLLLEQFEGVEGIQEENMEKQSLLESVLDIVVHAGSDVIKGDKDDTEQIKEMLTKLLIVQRLLSSSQFADIDNIPLNGEIFPENALQERKVSDEELKEKTGELLNEFEEYFKGHERKINRAVMANVLSCLPVFFQSTEDVKEYIYSSLSQCRDESERKVSMELIQKLIDEECGFS